METTQIHSFKQRVANYLHDNLPYIEETNEAPTAQDVLDHWDTNGPEGVGEELSLEQREIFLNSVTRFLGEGAPYVP